MSNSKFMNYFWAYTTENPLLGNVRGKIVIVQNFKVNFNVFEYWVFFLCVSMGDILK